MRYENRSRRIPSFLFPFAILLLLTSLLFAQPQPIDSFARDETKEKMPPLPPSGNQPLLESALLSHAGSPPISSS